MVEDGRHAITHPPPSARKFVQPTAHGRRRADDEYFSIPETCAFSGASVASDVLKRRLQLARVAHHVG